MKNILVTGGLGFIGFNAVQLWSKNRPDLKLFIVDNETYAAKFKLQDKHIWLREHAIQFFKCDICDEFSIDALVKQNKIDTIVNFAAESHVDNSIINPDVFFESNILGTTKLLNIAKKYNLRFHHVSTDEVYGETTPSSWNLSKYDITYSDIVSSEEMPLKPSSPYSASKAAADMITLAYARTYNVNATISRCTNNFGPWQHPEKLIGTIVKNVMHNKKVPIYGNGKQKRHWIFVDEHNNLIMKILENGKSGNIYNIAPPKNNYISNLTLTKFILKVLNVQNEKNIIEHVVDRPGHDISYYLIGTDFCQSKRKWQFDMANTVVWYQNNIEELKKSKLVD